MSQASRVSMARASGIECGAGIREIPDPALIRKDRGSARRDAGEHPCERRTRGHPQLLERVAEVGLDGLLAEEELGRDLPVGPTRHHEPGDLELTSCEPGVARPAPPPPCYAPSQPAELARRLVGITHRAVRGELGLG